MNGKDLSKIVIDIKKSVSHWRKWLSLKLITIIFIDICIILINHTYFIIICQKYWQLTTKFYFGNVGEETLTRACKHGGHRYWIEGALWMRNILPLHRDPGQLDLNITFRDIEEYEMVSVLNTQFIQINTFLTIRAVIVLIISPGRWRTFKRHSTSANHLLENRESQNRNLMMLWYRALR